MKNIVVTGGSGRLGSRVVTDLLEHGYDVLCVDRQPPRQPVCKSVTANLCDLGEVYEVLKGEDAVVHLAAIPGLTGYPDDFIFRNNVIGTYHVLEAASAFGIRKAVIASSESSYGFFWAHHEISPRYVPVDEHHPQLPQEAYGLSKIINEETASMFYRRYGMQVAALRFSYITVPEDYPRLVRQFDHPEALKRNLWSYVDIRDAASACRLALEAEGLGAAALNIAADETLASIGTKQLLNEYYPDVKDIRSSFEGFEAPISNKKAKELLNWQPVHGWNKS